MAEETSPKSTKVVVGACSECGALTLAPDWAPGWVGFTVRSCMVVYSAGACPGTVRVIGWMPMEAAPNG